MYEVFWKWLANCTIIQNITSFRSNRPELFLGKGALKICNKFAGEHPCPNAISIKLLYNSVEIELRHGCSSVNLLQTTYWNRTLKSHLGMGVLLQILCTFSEYLFPKAPLKDCFWSLCLTKSNSKFNLPYQTTSTSYFSLC